MKENEKMKEREELKKKIEEVRKMVEELNKFEKTMHFLDDHEEVEMYQLLHRKEQELAALEKLYWEICAEEEEHKENSK